MQWKWSNVKAGGLRPAARSGVSIAVAQNGKAYAFGGVLDVTEDEENLEGLFSNEVHTLDLSNQVWRLIELTGKREKKSGKNKNDSKVDSEEKMEEVETVTTDGVFTMTVGGTSKQGSDGKSKTNEVATNIPSPRMKPGMAICKGHLYLYGGEVENGSKHYTLNDFYSLGAFQENSVSVSTR